MDKIEKSGIIIINGKKLINEIKKQYKIDKKVYNELLKENQNLFFRATHVKRGKKIYYYWYKYEWDPVKKRTVHKYIGKNKPNEEIPNPPINPFTNLHFKEITGTQNIILSIDEYEEFKHYFKNFKIQYIVNE